MGLPYPRTRILTPLAPEAADGQTHAMRPRRIACLALLSLFLVAPGTQAGGPGKWTMLTERTGRNTTQVGTVRTRDGVLHVAWAESGANPTLWHVGIKANGAPAGAKNAIVTGFRSLSNPDLVARGRRQPAGLLRRPGNVPEQRAQHGDRAGDRCAVEPSGRQGGPGHDRVRVSERRRHDEGRDARVGMGDDVRNPSALRHESRRRRRRGADADPVLWLLPRRRHGRHRRQSRHRLVLERQGRGGPRHAGDRGDRAGRPEAVRAGNGRRASISVDRPALRDHGSPGRRRVRRLLHRLPDSDDRQPLEARRQGARAQDQGQRRSGREHRGRAGRPLVADVAPGRSHLRDANERGCDEAQAPYARSSLPRRRRPSGS